MRRRPFSLHTHGETVASVKDAASALQSLAGDYAFLLFTGGLVGAGLLAIPAHAGSAAHAFAETFDWMYGLDKRSKKALSFYAVFMIANHRWRTARPLPHSLGEGPFSLL